MQGEGAIHFDSNDPKALEHIVERYRVIAERLCFQYGVKPKEISTVVQDVFIKVDQKIKRQEPGSLSSWFYHVVIRTLREYESKQKKAKKIGRALDEPISYGYYLENHGHISIQDALAKLDNKYKLPLILNHYHDIKLEDISTILKMNQETITKRIQQGENLLSDSYKEAATKNPYLVDKFEAVFRDLNYRYQLLPEFTSTVDIMTRVEQSRKKNHWKKYIAPVGAVVGLCVFAVFGLNYMQEQKVAIEAAKEMEKSNQMPNPIDTDQVKEERELNPEITEYLEKAIDNFALELGLEDVSDFPIVVEVQTIIYDLYQSPDHVIGTDVSETKNYIDMMLTPPAAQLEKMKAPQDTEAYSLMETFGVYYNYEYHFQNYLATLLSELPIEEYDVIYELQDNPENYYGPEDIKTLLQIFNEQGYLVKKDPIDNYLVVDIDVGRLKNQLAEKGYGDAYLAYLDYYVVAHDFDWNNWKELANILIEAESLLVTYGDSYNREMRRELYNSIEQHLYSYLRYWGDVYEVSEEEKNEYYSFINNYPDTKVAQVVQSYLSEWEANDWKRTQGHSYTPEPIDLLFEYDNVNYEDIVVMGRWPFVGGIGAVYKEYSSNLDTTYLLNLSPFEIVALFGYSYEKEDKETYSTLLSQKTYQPAVTKWEDLRNLAGYALTEYHDDDSASVIFTDWEKMDVGKTKLLTIEMIKDNDIWKIKHIQKDSPN